MINTLVNRKEKGRVYTPDYIVCNILDLCGYSGQNILRKHIIDNSCGDGAFLCEIVRRYCETAENSNISPAQLREDLSEFIHGVEIDENECAKCIENLTMLAENFGVYDVAWDIIVADTLTLKTYDGKMDYVVGNPPYVRVHNLSESYENVKRFSFAQNGMTDLFIVFYEIGLKMLNENGILGYISPSSLFNSLAGSFMRNFLVKNRNIKAVVDLKHFQPFNAVAYTTIMLLTKQPQKSVVYYDYNENTLNPEKTSELSYEDFYVNGSFVFGQKKALLNLKKITCYTGNNAECEVKNGFATLCDDFFIGDYDFSEFTIPVIKASTGKKKKCLYPYDKNGKLLPYERLTADDNIKKHYEQYIEKLKSRSFDKSGSWYGFGRSQGINDVYKTKYAVNALIRDYNDIKLSVCPPGTGVYSGLYILSNRTLPELESILRTEDFISYIAMLGKYKNGGYYTFSSKDLKLYINYKFAEKSGHKYEQLSIS
jgi:adenine-specific DNA-methyltransferase